MSRWITVALLAVLLLPAAGHGRSEATFCVGVPACTGTSLGSVQRAVTAAAATTGPDIILLGPGTFRENVFADAGNPVEIRGTGADRTTLAPGNLSQAALRLSDPASRVSALTIRLPVGALGGLLLDAGTADGVQIIGEPGLTRSGGFSLRGDARFVNGTVSLPVASPDVANFAAAVHTSTASIDNSMLTATLGVFTRGGTVTRTRIQAVLGMYFSGDVAPGELRAYDDLIVVLGIPGSSFRPVGLAFAAMAPGASVLRARHLTIFSLASGVIGAAVTATGGGATAIASIDDSVLWGPEMTAFHRNAGAGGTSRLSVNWSDFPPAFENIINPGSSGDLALSPTNANTDPRFIGGGDLHLRPDSPLVDHGSTPGSIDAPSEPTVDLAGNARIFDGDNDRVAQRDMGAYEVVLRDSRPTKTGTGRRETLRGTLQSDALYGRGGNDTLRGRGGDDWLYGGAGLDKLYGDAGNDDLFGSDGKADLLDCGPGTDTAFADRFDKTRSCETVVSFPVRLGMIPAQPTKGALPALPALASIPPPVITPPLSPSLSIEEESPGTTPAVYKISGSGWDKCENDIVLTNVTNQTTIATPDADTSGNFTITAENLKKGDVVRGEEKLCDGVGDSITAEATVP